MTAESVSTAVALAREHGLRVERPVVLRDVVNLMVDLAPSGVVARSTGLIGERRGAAEHAAREVSVASFLAAAGAPVGRPATALPPGPHVRDGHVITFWQLEDHDRARLDPAEAARALRLVHEALVDYPGPLPASTSSTARLRPLRRGSVRGAAPAARALPHRLEPRGRARQERPAERPRREARLVAAARVSWIAAGLVVTYAPF